MSIARAERLKRLWGRLRSFYWLTPGLMVSGCFGLAYLMLAIDDSLGNPYVLHLSWIYTRGPEGARTLLSVISQSMITVAGVVFSITVVALTVASNQFGTRVLKSFARDKGNQVVLGTLLGTFVYGIVVLRRVQQNFIPGLSVAFAIVLASVSTGMLVYFLHHVNNEMQAENVVAAVARDLYSTIEVIFPERIGDSAAKTVKELSAEEAALLASPGDELYSDREGYVQTIDPVEFLAVAEKHDAVVRLAVLPGTFVTEHQLLATYWSRNREAGPVHDPLKRAVKIGNERTYQDDLGFGLQQLSLIAVRSLSPSINAVGAALDAVDRLAASLVRVGDRKIPSPYRRGSDGQLRVITCSWDLDSLLASSFDPIRNSAAKNPTVVGHTIESLAQARNAIRNADLRKAVSVQIERFGATINRFEDEGDIRRLRQIYDRLRWPGAA